LVGKAERKRLGGPGHRWENKIKMNLEETGREDVNWVHLSQDRNQGWGIVNTANEPFGSIKSWGLLWHPSNYSFFEKDSAVWSSTMHYRETFYTSSHTKIFHATCPTHVNLPQLIINE
jgi:hypothetical protein